MTKHEIRILQVAVCTCGAYKSPLGSVDHVTRAWQHHHDAKTPHDTPLSDPTNVGFVIVDPDAA